jgi:hypothetical protein
MGDGDSCYVFLAVLFLYANPVFIVVLFKIFSIFLYCWPSGFETVVIMNCYKLRATSTCVIPSLEWLTLEVLIESMEWNIRAKEEITGDCRKLRNEAVHNLYCTSYV